MGGRGPQKTPTGGARNHRVGTCPDCGKYRYPTRKAAKRAAQDLFPGDPQRAYPCGEYWHHGHNPDWLKRGEEPPPWNHDPRPRPEND